MKFVAAVVAASFGTVLVAAASTVAAAPSSAFAASASGASVAMTDCASASHAMMEMPKQETVTPTGNVDTDFMTLAAANMKMMVAMAKMEMRCGKDAKTRRFAATIVDHDLSVLKTLQIGNGTTH